MNSASFVRPLLLVTLLLATAACAQTERGESAKVPESMNPTMPAPSTEGESSMIDGPVNSTANDASCNADAAQAWVGKPASDENVAAVRDAAGARSTRVISPGQPVTMDFRGDRLNVEVDAARMIVRLSCG